MQQKTRSSRPAKQLQTQKMNMNITAQCFIKTTPKQILLSERSSTMPRKVVIEESNKTKEQCTTTVSKVDDEPLKTSEEPALKKKVRRMELNGVTMWWRI